MVFLIFISYLFSNTIHIPADYATIQAGLDNATFGDIVFVAAGTYYENIIWPATNGIQLIGEDQETTIIDGDSLASVIRFEGWFIDTTTLVSGFTIQNGYAHEPDPFGAGILCEFSSPSLANLTITNNSAEHGGGMCCSFSSPSLTNVTIANNSASDNGGGMFCADSSPSLKNLSIRNN